jgi:hypothetical protein
MATLRASLPNVVGYRPTDLRVELLLPTRLDALAPPQDADWLAALSDASLLHTECQGYRDPSFLERVFRYHLWLVLQDLKRRVHTVALWLMDPPAAQTAGEVEIQGVRIRVHSVVVPRVPAEALLDDPMSACFAAGAHRGSSSDEALCARVAKVLRESGASWNRRHMAVVAAATQGRYNAMLKAMEHEHMEPIIIEDLVHIGQDIGRKEGYKVGHEEGHKEGHKEGAVATLRDSIRKVLAVHGVLLSEVQRAQLDACDDPALISRWFDRALRGDAPADWLG